MNPAGHDKPSATPIAAANFELAVDAPLTHGANPRTRLFILIVATALLALAVLAVVFVLPRWIAPSSTPAVVHQADAPDHATPSNDDPEPAVEASRDDPAARENTQQQLQETLDKLAVLEAIEGEQWAKAELHRIRERIAEGEKAYREKRYVTATNIYLDTSAAVDRLLAGVPDIVQSLLERGDLALAQGDSAAATAAFDQALRMAPDNTHARRGHARAATLDQVLALTAQAQGYEQLGQSDKAVAAYREALKLDAAATEATAAIARIARDDRESTIRAAMSKGLAALADNRFDDARSAFAGAAKLDSNREALKAAIRQLDNAEANYHIERNLAQANKAVTDERWADAESAFNAALKHDERLTPALTGRQQSAMRRRLDEHLRELLAKPERFASNQVHAEASKLLETARALRADGPRLKQQIAALDRALVLARTPLNVVLSSDGATLVTIYKVGELGRFEQRGVELLPGNYTIVGTRDGYRDVRVELALRHGTDIAPVTVQCNEQIASGN